MGGALGAWLTTGGVANLAWEREGSVLVGGVCWGEKEARGEDEARLELVGGAGGAWLTAGGVVKRAAGSDCTKFAGCRA